MIPRFELKEARNGSHFNLIASNGKIILTSEVYSSMANAIKGIDSVQSNSPNPDRYDRRRDRSGKPYFVLRARNNKVIGRSEQYESNATMEKGIRAVMRYGRTFVVIGQKGKRPLTDAQQRRQIAELQDRVDDGIAEGTTLGLDETTFGSATTLQLVQAAIGGSPLKIEGVETGFSGTSLSVQGTADILGIDDLPVEVEFTPTPSGPTPTIRGTSPAGTPILLIDIADDILDGTFSVPQQFFTFGFESFSITTDLDDETVTFVARSMNDVSIGGGLIVLQETTLTLVSSPFLQGSPTVQASLDGTLVIGGIDFDVRGSFESSAPEDATFALEPVANVLSIETFVEHFLVAIPALPDLQVSGLEFDTDLNNGFFDFQAEVDGSWTIPLGISPPSIDSPRISIARDSAGVSGSIHGQIEISGSVFEVAADLEGELSLAGTLPSVDLNELAVSLVGSAVPLPTGFPSITLPETQIEIRLDGNTAVLAAAFQLADFGDGFTIVLNLNGEWEVATGFALPDDWVFGDISGTLSPLDQVLTNFDPPAFMISSFDNDAFQFPDIAPGRLPLVVIEGVTIVSTLQLEGPFLSLIKALLQQPTLPLLASFSDTLATTEVRATLDQQFSVIPGLLTFENVAVSVTVATPPAVTFSSDARIDIEGLPLLTANATIESGQTSIGLATAEVWENPFGIPKLMINRLAVQFSTTPVVYTILGDVEIAGQQIKMVVQVVGNAPTAVVGSFPGELSIVQVVGDLVGLDIPPGFPEIVLIDFRILAVSVPFSIDGEQFQSGLSLSGGFDFFGLKGSFLVEVDPDNGVHAAGALAESVKFGNVLEISNAAGDGPPSAELETRLGVANSPFLEIDGRYALLGLEESLKARASDGGISFELKQKLGPAEYRLTCVAESVSNFQANGDFEFDIDESIEISHAGTTIADVSIQFGINGSLELSLINDTFSASIVASFSLFGQEIQIAQISLNVAPDSLENIRQEVQERVIERARETIENLFDNIDHIDAHGDGPLIPAVNTHGDAGHGDAHGDAGHGDAHGDAGHGDAHGDAGHGDGHADVGHADIHGDGGHGDAHGDSGQHIDEHGDGFLGSFHGDETPFSAHLDESLGGAHGDKGGLGLHGDSNAVGVHGDSSSVGVHGDSGQVGVHGDSAEVGVHGDTPEVLQVDFHGDVPPGPHADTPLIPAVSTHGDVGHGDAHGDAGHGDAHGDAGHGDAHGDAGHGDAHGDAGHGDIHTDLGHGDQHADIGGLGGPHFDFGGFGLHGDSSAVGVHGDSSSVGVHGDSAEVGVHGDSAEVGLHGDSPETGFHADTPEFLHGDFQAFPVPVGIAIRVGGVTPEQFQDFLVGQGQFPITVEIETIPEDASVNWTVTPDGEESGVVLPNQGTSKSFTFTPNVVGARPVAGSMSPNAAVSYTIEVTATHGTHSTNTVSETITQNTRTILRQEYVDYGLTVPPMAQVANALATANFSSGEFSATSNYAPLVVNGGMQAIAQSTRFAYSHPIRLTSAFRNPQRNQAIGGATNSIHQFGGAVDMVRIAADVGTLSRLVALYRAAVGVDPGLILLEHGPSQLLPGNWKPPSATHTFSVGNTTVVMQDSDDDDLPDRVAAIGNPPADGIPINTPLPYDGGGTANPDFHVVSQNNSNTIQVGDRLELNHPTGQFRTLRDIFEDATHVHADNRNS